MKWHPIRDAFLFFAGLGGLAYETLAGHAPRESLLVVFAAMMGLPAFLRADEKRGDRDDDEPKGKPVTTDHDRELADHLLEVLLATVQDQAKRATASMAAYPRTFMYGASAVLVALGVAL